MILPPTMRLLSAKTRSLMMAPRRISLGRMSTLPTLTATLLLILIALYANSRASGELLLLRSRRTGNGSNRLPRQDNEGDGF
jgi:hypothetical protein